MVKAKKELLFSLNKDDFVWIITGSSKKAGGQNLNRRSTNVEVRHEPSGAVGRSQDERSQWQNKHKALERLVATPAFRAWTAAKSRGLKTPLEIEKEVEESIANPNNIKLEIKDGKGWKEAKETELT